MKNRIREVRRRKNITHSKLVENIRITRQYISLIELGDETPSLKVANEIASALGACMYVIFDLDGTEDIDVRIVGGGSLLIPNDSRHGLRFKIKTVKYYRTRLGRRNVWKTSKSIASVSRY